MIVPASCRTGGRAVRELSCARSRAIGGWGLARVDFLYDEAADQLYVNELNTMPGFTAHSMYPKVWAAVGVAYPELVDRLVELGLVRHATAVAPVRNPDDPAVRSQGAGGAQLRRRRAAGGPAPLPELRLDRRRPTPTGRTPGCARASWTAC